MLTNEQILDAIFNADIQCQYKGSTDDESNGIRTSNIIFKINPYANPDKDINTVFNAIYKAIEKEQESNSEESYDYEDDSIFLTQSNQHVTFTFNCDNMEEHYYDIYITKEDYLIIRITSLDID